jgi:hypothetical protein
MVVARLLGRKEANGSSNLKTCQPDDEDEEEKDGPMTPPGFGPPSFPLPALFG